MLLAKTNVDRTTSRKTLYLRKLELQNKLIEYKVFDFSHQKKPIVYRDCDVNYNCNDPVSQSEYSVLTFMRHRALFIFLLIKIKAFWFMEKLQAFCCVELNIKDYFICRNFLIYCFVSILWGFISFARYQIYIDKIGCAFLLTKKFTGCER